MGEIDAKRDRVKRHALRHDYLREWSPNLLWAPSCYHGSVGHGWEVVEKYISGQKDYSYEKNDAVPVVVIDEEEENIENTYNK